MALLTDVRFNIHEISNAMKRSSLVLSSEPEKYGIVSMTKRGV